MATETELLRLALMAYEAASEPELWLRFLKCFAEIVSGDSSVLQIHDLGRHISTVISGFGLNVPFTQSYNEYYSKLNLWRERGRALFIPGRVNLSEEMCPRAVLERSEFYNDCMLRADGAYSMGAVLAREGDCAPTLSTQRGRRKGPFGEPEREIARFILPHLSRAWIASQRLALLAAGESVLDSLPQGVVFLTAAGRALYWNRAAAEIFQANDGLSVRNGALAAVDRTCATQLSKAIGAALSPSASRGPLTVTVPRPSLRRDYQVTAAPLRTRFRQFAGTPAAVAVVLVTDPEWRPSSSTDLLRQIYGLTRKEAAVAARLYEGRSVEQAAGELSITYETARTHLRRILSKTGTSRQSELLLLMARLPVWPPSS